MTEHMPEYMKKDEKSILVDDIRLLMEECGEEQMRIDNLLSSENVEKSTLDELKALKSKYTEIKTDYAEVNRLTGEIEDFKRKPVDDILDEIDTAVKAKLGKMFGVDLPKNSKYAEKNGEE